MIQFIARGVIWLLLSEIQLISSQVTKPPNIIFVVADDLGWDDMSYSVSHQVISPTIAKFRSEARLLEYYYGQAVCAPTRTSIHTGRYPCHTGINTNIVASYSYCPSFENKYLPLILREYGNYETHMVGKWHCGFYKWRCTPTFRGYESFFGYYTGGEDHYFHTEGKIYDFHLEDGINCGPNCSVHYTSAYGHYATYYFTDRAKQIIRNHSRSDSGKPLFLYLAYQNVHLPAEAPPKYLAEYNVTQKSGNDRTIHCAQATTLDASFKNVTDLLAEGGYLDDETGNTVIIFTSDNGGLPGNGGGYNFPLRGGKLDIWEGGTRLQAWFWATKDIMKNKDKLAGGNYTELSHVVDWLPTLVEGAAGVKISDLGLNYTLDGVNQWEGLIGNDDNVDNPYFAYRDNIWYGHDMPPSKEVGNNTAYRNEWMKLYNGTNQTYNGWYYPPPLGNGSGLHEHFVNSSGLAVLLYNISDDPYEYKDLANDSNYAQIVEQLWKEMGDIQETCIQLVNDSTCPDPTYELVTIPGTNQTIEAFIPWCGE